jgi:hypothetical protein
LHRSQARLQLLSHNLNLRLEEDIVVIASDLMGF